MREIYEQIMMDNSVNRKSLPYRRQCDTPTLKHSNWLTLIVSNCYIIVSSSYFLILWTLWTFTNFPWLPNSRYCSHCVPLTALLKHIIFTCGIYGFFGAVKKDSFTDFKLILIQYLHAHVNMSSPAHLALHVEASEHIKKPADSRVR